MTKKKLEFTVKNGVYWDKDYITNSHWMFAVKKLRRQDLVCLRKLGRLFWLDTVSPETVAGIHKTGDTLSQLGQCAKEKEGPVEMNGSGKWVLDKKYQDAVHNMGLMVLWIPRWEETGHPAAIAFRKKVPVGIIMPMIVGV